MKRLYVVIPLIVILFFSPPSTLHRGNTDSSGGHYNHSTGEYHYHHGYPAHSHYDMDGDGIIDCPYDFKDNTDHNSNSSNNSQNNNGWDDYDKDQTTINNTEKPQESISFYDVIISIALITIFSIAILGVGFVTGIFLLVYYLLLELIKFIAKKVFRKDISDSNVPSVISFVIIVCAVITVSSVIVIQL